MYPGPDLDHLLDTAINIVSVPSVSLGLAYLALLALLFSSTAEPYR
jgi:hypothetical protein